MNISQTEYKYKSMQLLGAENFKTAEKGNMSVSLLKVSNPQKENIN